MDSTERLVRRMVSWEISPRDRTFCSFSPSAFRMWDRAGCCSATDSNRSEMAWKRGLGAAVVVVVVDVVDVVVVVEVVVVEVVELVLVVVVLVLVVVVLVDVVVLVLAVVVLLVVVDVEVVEVEVVVDVVLVVVVVVLVVVLLVVKRQTVGSGSWPVNSSLWLSEFPV